MLFFSDFWGFCREELQGREDPGSRFPLGFRVLEKTMETIGVVGCICIYTYPGCIGATLG